ncbi:MAG: FliO/MopB family protein [Leptospirales bacterium]
MNPGHVHHASLLWVGGRLLGSLLLVVVLFLGAVWLLRFLQRKTLTGGSSSREMISVRTSCTLAPKTTLSVVSVGGESFLIGVTPQSISLLARLSDGSEDRRPAETTRGAVRTEFVPAGQTGPFVQEDRRGPESVSPRPVPEASQDPESNFEHLVQGALEKIRKGRQERETPSGRKWSV